MNKKLLAIAVAAFSTNAFSAAHLLPELGSVNASTAGAGSAALAGSALTAWTNPAGMSQLEEANLTVNVAALGTSVDFTDKGSALPGDDNIDAGGWAPVASMYFVTPINDQFHAGIALASQGGSGVDYGNNFSGGFLLENVEFMTVQLMPSVSYKVNEKLALGVSANIEYLTANGELDLLSDLSPGLLSADANDLTVGYSLSAFYKINEKHRLGVIYRSELSHYGEGDLEQTASDLKTDVGLDFIMPQHVQVSGVHTVAPKWDMLWSVIWYDLSTWTDLTLDVGDLDLPAIVVRDFDDVWNFAIGTHYQLSDQWRLETGISYETSPQDNPENQYMDLPVGETKRIGFGTTYQLNEQWQLKGYYDYIDLGSPDINYQGGLVKGSYDNSAHFVGFQANFKFK
ncbi:OmpP1/FadL family transporter [Vibrio maerlii]|uniref:OmpP1/FadL family transporter n=1 Tax=Vibrio maerlii TaxID=2231648 RepID=UPI000E3C0309|nr:outer membrane protein transport protein [Vibrio maerlii]